MRKQAHSTIDHSSPEQPRPRALNLARGLDGLKLRAPGHSSTLAATDLRPVPSRHGWFYFAVRLRNSDAVVAAALPSTPTPLSTPIMTGIISGGGRGVQPWIEGSLVPLITTATGENLDVRGAGLEAALVDEIGRLLPPGSHLMVEYESPGQTETHAALLLRVPPAATHLGALMFHAGFRGEFKDWYISEGGHEGLRKLQANKSPHPAAARAALQAHREELTWFVERPLPARSTDAAIVARGHERARALLRELKN